MFLLVLALYATRMIHNNISLFDRTFEDTLTMTTVVLGHLGYDEASDT